MNEDSSEMTGSAGTGRRSPPDRLPALDALFMPESVAVIGASRDADKIGHTVMRNFVESTFTGDVYPVNPHADDILGYTSYDSVTHIEDDIDLAVVAVPPGVANEVIRECVEVGVDAVIVITSGYREIGGEGKERSEELQEILSGSDTRLLGPNCLGVWDAYTGIDTLFLPSYKLQRPPAGEIAIITQSGSFGSGIMDMLADMGVGVSRFVSYGNQADITEIELLEWLKDDEKTGAIAVYMEGVSDGERFVETTKQVTPDMPVITLKGGKSQEGTAAVSSHTGSLAGSYNVYQGAFRQTGVLEGTTIEEMFDYSRALAYNTPITDARVAVVTNGGGFGVLASDALAGRGLEMAEFASETEERLRSVVPSYGNIGNPLDLVGDADAERFEKALHIVAEDDGVDGIIAIPLLQPLPMDSDVVDTLIGVREEYDTPLVACLAGGAYTKLHTKNLEQNEVAAYPSPERAAAAMEALQFYGAWRDRHRDV